jgi:hypothetical protein
MFDEALSWKYELIVKDAPDIRGSPHLALSSLDCSLVYFSRAADWAVLYHGINLGEITFCQTLIDSVPIAVDQECSTLDRIAER